MVFNIYNWLLYGFMFHFVNANQLLPTIFWNPDSPALDRRYWSKVVKVNIFQSITFLCPNNYVNIVPVSRTGPYYNLYMREILPNNTNLDYDTVCDPQLSELVFACNVSRTEKEFSSKLLKRLRVSPDQALDEPVFIRGKDYIFFSTSNGNQNSLRTSSKKCTMVFRIHFCDLNEPCPLPSCATYGREEVCAEKSTTDLITSGVLTLKDVRITETSTSSLSVAWQQPLNTSYNVSYYSICYRRVQSSDECVAKVIESDATTVILDRLNASTQYGIRVRAHTCWGTGNYSMEITGTTLSATFAASQPRDVTVLATSTSSLTVSWTVPQYLTNDVIYYAICYRSNKLQQCRTQLAEASQRSAEIYNLNESANYVIRIRAHTSVGPGAYSDGVEMAVKGPVTGKETGEEECKGIQWISFVVGLVTGVVPMVAVTLLVYCLGKKRWKVHQDEKVNAVRNATNDAYRASTVIVDDNKVGVRNGTTSNTSVELAPI